MNSAQLKLFKGITLDYFAKLTSSEESPEMEDAYLQFEEPLLLDYTSMVHIAGECEGCIYLTAPNRLLEHLLAIYGEKEISDRTLRDMSRELSNVLAGNASHAFGGNWEISVPVSLTRGDFDKIALPNSTFIMPFHWRDTRSFLVIGLSESAPR